MSWLLMLLPLGPAEAIAGKYVRHCAEYRKLYPAVRRPLPATLPRDVDRLCTLIQEGHGTPQLLAALGEALMERGDKALAYRALDKALRLEHPDPRRIAQLKGRCTYVPDRVIRKEEREASIWVDALQSYERERIRRGEDARDLGAFYERYGRPGDDLNRIIRMRRISFLGGVAGIFLGIAFALGATRLPKRAVVLPLLACLLSLAAALLIGARGPLLWGAGFSLAGGIAVGRFGK